MEKMSRRRSRSHEPGSGLPGSSSSASESYVCPACSTVISLNGKVMSQVIKGHKTQCRSFAEQKARHEAAEKAVATEAVATDDVAAAAAARDAPAASEAAAEDRLAAIAEAAAAKEEA